MRTGFRFLKPILSVCLLLCAAKIVTALDQYQIQSWTTDDGLPQNTVRAILQTPDGYLWMTTLDGLARFDGVRFTIFNKQNSPGFASNRLFQMVQTADGDLWISAETDYIMRYHGGKFTSFDLGGDQPNNVMRSLLIDEQGAPLIISNAGIFRWNGENFASVQPIPGETNRSVFLRSRSGACWFGSGSLLHRLQNGKISDFQLSNAAPTLEIVSLFEDSRGRIWIGTHNGIFIIENEQIKILTTADGLPNNDARSFYEDRAGNIWVLTVEGVVTIAPDGKIGVTAAAEGLSDNSVLSIFQDREGSIWIGTLRRGLNRLTRRSISFYSTQNGLASPVVHPIYQLADGDVLLGGGGVTLFHDSQFSPFSLPSNNNIESVPRSATSIAQDRTERIWVGHWNGVYTYENGKFIDFTKIFSGMHPSVYDIHESRDGAMWFATSGGIFLYQNDAVVHFTKAQNNLAGDDAKVIHESADGTLWFGTYGGLSKYQEGAFTSYTTTDGLASNQVRSLYEDASGVLWIGSYDGGLTRFKDGKFTRYTTADGLFNDGVFQILEDDSHNLWMSSNRGIYRVAKQQLDDFADGKISRIEGVAYDKSDGLLETECNGGQQPAGAKMRDGKLWFPTQDGVAVIDPETIQKNPVAPPVVIETAKIDGEGVALNDEIEVAPGKNNLEINYTGLSFIKPEFVRFRYQLKGQDKSWIEAGNRRTAYYSYLPPGEYVFTVVAANADGVWNETGASVKVKVVPVFFRTLWFLTLMTILVISSVFAFYRWRVRRLERARHLQESFSRQLIESQEVERQRIAAELHDGLGQSLLVIKNRALLGKMSLDSKTESGEQFEEISSASSQAIEEVREIAYNLRPYHLDRLGLTQSVKVMLEPLADLTGIDFAYDVMPLEGVFSKTEEVFVYRIIQESVNNIVKHSGASEASVLIHRGTDGGNADD